MIVAKVKYVKEEIGVVMSSDHFDGTNMIC
jgi:hypothetical protein